MTGPELNKMEIGNELDVAESNMINGLTLKAFDIDAKKEDTDEMKEVLKNTKIKMITGVDADSKKTMEEKTLVEIADAFVSYVEKGEGWRLKLIESEKDKAPTWINYIVENPQNNDLAYFVQKIAELISYQTARMYTEQELESVKVNVDKTFGNQTRRALVGLKSWIENTGNTTVEEGKKYEGRYLDKSFVEGVISDKKTDEEKSKAIERYNLIYKDGKVQPLDGYAFIDPYSNNYAVKKGNGDEKPIVAIDSGNKDKFGNEIMNISDISQLPKDNEGNYRRSEKKVYLLTKDGVDYRFYANGRVAYGSSEKDEFTNIGNTKDIIAQLSGDARIKLADNTPDSKNISTEKIGKRMFSSYEDRIEEYMSTLGGNIQINRNLSENPYIYIVDNITWNTIEKINVNAFIQDETLDMESIKKYINALKKRIANLEKTIKALRGKSYSLEELYGTGSKESKNDAYKEFFNDFKGNNSKVKIDKSETYTLFPYGSGYDKIQFDFDEDGIFDHGYCKDITIDVTKDKVVNDDGTLNEEGLKKFLANKITTIINNPENGYV